ESRLTSVAAGPGDCQVVSERRQQTTAEFAIGVGQTRKISFFEEPSEELLRHPLRLGDINGLLVHVSIDSISVGATQMFQCLSCLAGGVLTSPPRDIPLSEARLRCIGVGRNVSGSEHKRSSVN